MAAFEYVALDADGRQKKGIIEGDSGRQARQALRDRGLTPVAIDATSERKANGAQGGSGLQQLRFNFGMSMLDLALFTRQLATLIAAGLPIEEALSAVAQQTDKRRNSAMIMTVRARVLEGHSLAHALGEFPSTFSDMFRSTVSAGEQSGFLHTVLDNLADYTESRFESRRNVEMALFYPIVLLLLAIAIVGALLIYVVPDIVRVFENTGEDLPFLTRVMIGTSEFLRSYLWLVALVVVGIVFGVRWMLARPDVRLAWDQRKLSFPLVGRIGRGGNAARYASTLSILTSSGVPLVDAMNIAAEVVNNQYLKRRLADAVQRVSEGASLRSALESAGNFPPMFLHMIASGESSGQLDTMLAKVASYQQAELERLVTTLVRLFEPLMLLFMGGLVMMIVLAILLPILSMNQLVV